MIPGHYGDFVMEANVIDLLPWHLYLAGRHLFLCFAEHNITTSTLGSAASSTPQNIPKLADGAPRFCLDRHNVVHRCIEDAGFDVNLFRPHTSQLWKRDISLGKVLGAIEYSMHVEQELERIREEGGNVRAALTKTGKTPNGAHAPPALGESRVTVTNFWRPATYKAFAEAFHLLAPHQQDASYIDLLHRLNDVGVVVPMGEERDSPLMSVYIAQDDTNAWKLIQDIIRVYKLVFPGAPYHSRSRRRKENFIKVGSLNEFEWNSVFDPPYLNYLDDLDELDPFPPPGTPSQSKPKVTRATRRSQQGTVVDKADEKDGGRRRSPDLSTLNSLASASDHPAGGSHLEAPKRGPSSPGPAGPSKKRKVIVLDDSSEDDFEMF